MVGFYGGHYVGELVSGKELVSYSGSNKYGHHLWFWKCPHCKELRGPTTVSHLKRSERGRCLSQTCSKGDGNPNWCGYKELSGSFLYQYRKDAQKKGRLWSVTAEELWQKWEEQQGKCSYTGRPLTHGVDASIDRIDSSKGYTLDNIQWVHKDINRMKTDFPEDTFIGFCREVAAHRFDIIGFDASVPAFISEFVLGRI